MPLTDDTPVKRRVSRRAVATVERREQILARTTGRANLDPDSVDLVATLRADLALYTDLPL